MALPLPFDTQGLPTVNAIVQGGGGGITVDVGADPQSQPAPNPAAINDPVAVSLMAEPDHALRTSTLARTDAISFNDDFNGADVWTVLPGTITIAPGGTALVGTAAAIAALKAGDYIEVAADDLPATPAWTQVRSIDSATTATLEGGYAGAAGGVAAVGRRSPWIIQYTGAGAGIAVAASVVTITPAPGAAGVALLTRKVGFGGRKGFRPVRILGDLALSAILPNQLGLFGFGNNPDITAATATASVRANNATTLRVTVARDGFLTNDDYVLPNGGLTSAGHLVELEWTHHGMNLWVDRVLALVNVGSHIADPYDDLYYVVGVWNTGNPGGAALLTSDVVEGESINLLDARVTQPNASKLHATVKDATPFGTDYTPPAVVAVADNLAHQVCTAMDLGHGYLITQIGGAALQALVVAPGGGAPAVATIRLSPVVLFNGIPWEFRPRAQGEQVYVAKSVNGTADATVLHSSTDLGNGA